MVLDTNIVLSALVFTHGRLAALRHAWHDRRCHPLISRITAAELVRALTYPKFELAPGEQQELLADYLPFCVTVRIPAQPPKTPACRDSSDVPFLQLALAGKADYLVTGDGDLLSLAKVSHCPIVTADRFLAMLARGGRR